MKYSPFYTQNLEVMAAQKQKAAMWLAETRPDLADIDSRMGHNSYGMLDFRLKDGRFLFETIPPGPIYQGWVPQDAIPAESTFVIGCNLGYGLNHLLSGTPASHTVYVLEPEPEMLAACLGQTDYRPFITSGKLVFLPPDRTLLQDTVRACDVQFLFGRIHLRADLPSQQIGPAYAYWARQCKEMLEHLSVEMGTLRRAQDTMVGNELGNFRRALADGTVNPLCDAGEGIKAVILGAGPSLEQSGPTLAAMQHSALVVTALQTLTAAQRVGVRPHFCMSIDFSDGMLSVYKQLDPEWAKDIPLIYSTKTDPRVVKQYPGPTIPLWTVGGLATFIAGRDDLVLDAAGNVSVALMRFLHWMGVRDIVLVGQDFAWRETSSTHADGHHRKKASRWVDLQDRDGNPIRTSVQYLTSAREMEQDIARLGLNVHNVYGGGYVISTATDTTLEDALQNGLLASDGGALELWRLRMMKARTGCEQPIFEERAPSWRTSLRHANKRLEKLFKKPEKNYAEIRSLFNSVHMFLRQDPIYMPYLYNEIMDVAGLRDARTRYTPKDMGLFRETLKKVLEKIVAMDHALGARSLEEHRAA
ncbi:motility associated factor glycosyltransferase family protein [Desulfovibrio psychrotolerans]|uniref:6-hydroxymethylpterin diphosphokinase MptE-like domain-containing protein n=1 Tax=Desulfovibrio psychrotolerans TaxID=415242 RepID=A0A7J0BX33_9BACT|nr:6-hydroxymethylpterin diphosphokinase MptE-like protein [Desulfovibrio psychrotolerans]GFM38258.1 hypothetical protein DSM19430T_29420 [Desulfovibrio psychrotolerans]